MPPKKKLSKKEKARLEAEQAELLRIELEKEKQKKFEEERRRKEIEREQAKKRKQEEIIENKERRKQLKHSMSFFSAVQDAIDSIKQKDREQHEWEKFMRCNGLPNASSPSDLRKYIHQWISDTEQRQQKSRNWLLQTDERTVLTHDANAADLTRTALKRQQGDVGDVYAQRATEVLGILTELNEVLIDKKKPPHTIADLNRLKSEIRVFLQEHLDEFSHKTMAYIERDMEIDRPGVSKHVYSSDIFKSHIWTFSKDAQISVNPKARLADPTQHNEILFPVIELEITLPPTVQLQSSALRGLWLNYDHFSDFCASFQLKRHRPEKMNILIQTKLEWRKRKEILQSMLDDCSKESPISSYDPERSTSSQAQTERRSCDVDKLYTEYEDALNKARRRAIGPEGFNLLDTDVNLRKYRIIGGVYCIDYLEVPQQDKRISAKTFIRTVQSRDCLTRKSFFQGYKPPPPVQPGVRRLPEEIEAEMRMIEAALDKLALVTIQLSNSVIWFEPPISCRWETKLETLESDLTEGIKQPSNSSSKNDNVHAAATPTEASQTPFSSATVSPLKSSPRFPARLRKRSSQKSSTTTTNTLPVRELNDFDMLNIPRGIDIYGLMKDFVVPRLPSGFCLRLQEAGASDQDKKWQYLKWNYQQQQKKRRTVLFMARHKTVNISRPSEVKIMPSMEKRCQQQRITEDFMENDEPRELFASINFAKELKFKAQPGAAGMDTNGNKDGDKLGKTEKIGRYDKSGNGGNGKKEKNVKINEKLNERQTEKAEVAETAQDTLDKKYMFSQLLQDLDRLCALELPLQEEALQKISANLSSTRSNSTESPAPENENEDKAKTVANEVATPTPAPTPMPTYPYFTFMREAEAAVEEQFEELEVVSSSSEYDAADYDEVELLAAEEEGTAKEKTKNFNTLGTEGIHDFLSKHSQSESGDSGDGQSKSKLSNAAALTQGKWSTRDVHDTKFNEDKFSIQFRTGRLGIFGFALNRYSNMPYQTWEIKPDLKSPGNILFSFTASIVSLDMNITSDGYCVNSFQGGSTDAINEMIGKTLSLAELKSILITSAVDIFPDDDAFCYTEGSCEKNFIMEMHLYACMSTLGLSHNFSWSRWNLLAGSRTAVILIRELIEGKKVPNHSTLLVTPLKTAIIECTEVSASFNAAGIPGMEYYADLYQLSQVHAQPSSLEKQQAMDAELRDNMAHILMAIRPISFC